MNKKLAVIGFGHMGSAIVEGALKANIFRPEDICVSDRVLEAQKAAAKLGVKTAATPSEAVANAESVLLAIKPSDLSALAAEIKQVLSPTAVIISICAGKRLETLAELFGESAALVRVMPNAPALVNEAMSALCASKSASAEQLSYARRIFDSFGKTAIVPEEQFDAVTAISGSGPAYVYSFINALECYAVESGMTPEQGRLFAAQTVLGSAKTVLESQAPPAALKEKICTPGGTTIEAVKVLDSRGFEQIIRSAAKACEARSRQLGMK